MEILKYKKMSNGRYKLELVAGKEIELYEETILKYELLLRKNITSFLLDEILEYNKRWDVYYVGLKSLKARFKSSKDLRDLLLKKEYPINLVDDAISKLIEQGYLNDRSFTKGYINNHIMTSSRGPLRISSDILNKGIDEEIVNEEILIFTEEIQIEKINKIIKSLLKSNRTRGGFVLKNKIINDLVSAGYSLSVINKVICNYEFDNNYDLAKKEYEKLYKKYSKKYSGKELDYKIKEKLYQKGLFYEEV